MWSAVALSTTVAALAAGGMDGRVRVERYMTSVWHLDVARDAFNGRSFCRIYQGDARSPEVSYSRGTLRFRLPHARSSLSAEFRIGDGPVRPWTSVYPTVIGLGATLPNSGMADQSGGVVVIPTSVIGTARRVTIRRRPGSRPVTFAVAALDEALMAAGRLRCGEVGGEPA